MNDWRWVELVPGVWVPATVVGEELSEVPKVPHVADLSDHSEVRPGVRKTVPRWVEILPGVWGPAQAAVSAAP